MTYDEDLLDHDLLELEGTHEDVKICPAKDRLRQDRGVTGTKGEATHVSTCRRISSGPVCMILVAWPG